MSLLRKLLGISLTRRMEVEMPFIPRPLPDRDQLLRDNPTLERRFRSKVRPGEPPYSGCWQWTGAMRNGYGYFGANLEGRQQMVLAHRIVYILAYGSIDDDLYTCHSCDNKSCVHPVHLYLADHRSNMRDMRASQRIRQWAEDSRITIREFIAGHIPLSDFEAVDE